MDGTLAKWNSVSFEQLYEEEYFLELEPNSEMVNLVNKLIDNEKDVYILSAFLNDSQYALYEKNEWINRHCPKIDENHRLFVAYGQSKALFFKDHGFMPITANDILIDDYTLNLIEWKKYNGTAVKYLNEINHTHASWNGMKINGSAENMYLLLSQLNSPIQEKLYVTYIHYADKEYIDEVSDLYCYGLCGKEEDKVYINVNNTLNNIGYLVANRDIMQDAIYYGLNIDQSGNIDYMDVLGMYEAIEYMNIDNLKNLGGEDYQEDDMELV